MVHIEAVTLPGIKQGHKATGDRTHVGNVREGVMTFGHDKFAVEIYKALTAMTVDNFDTLCEMTKYSDSTSRAVLKALIQSGKVSFGDVKELFDMDDDIYDMIGEGDED